MNKTVKNLFTRIFYTTVKMCSGLLFVFYACTYAESPIQAAGIEPQSEPDIFISEKVLPEEPTSQKELIEKLSSPYPSSYLTESLNPWNVGDPHELIEFEFENAELSNFIHYIEERFEVTFIMDDDLKPSPHGKEGEILGRKISFKTQKPLTKQDAWAVFLKFIDLQGFAVIPGPVAHTYRIALNNPKLPSSANKGPLPSFIGTNPDLLPNNDSLMRYVYFVQDASLETIKAVLDTMKSVSSPELLVIPEVRGIIITDKSYNIKSMLNIARELDTVTMPETMSIIKLKRTDATKVAKLYNEELTKKSEDTLASRLVGGRRPQTLSYFTPGTRVIAEPRTNTLIILGTEASVRKIEDFIVKEIDKEIEKPYSPIHVYELKHLKAKGVAAILSEAVRTIDPAKAGGVRDEDKYFRTVTIVPEESGNRLIITADYDDYFKIHEILTKMDVEQPQIAIRVLIVDINLNDNKQFGVQMRNKKPGSNGLLSNNIDFQTSGLVGAGGATQSIVENSSGTGSTRLLGNLITLASGGLPGSTYVALGNDCWGVWGMLQMLQSYTQTNLVASPFLVTTNNYPAYVEVGSTRRVQIASTVAAAGTPQLSYSNMTASIKVSITPQISYEGFVTVDVVVTEQQFTGNPNDPIQAGNMDTKEVATSVLLANNEVLALGGIISDTFVEAETKVPIIGDIPIVGWLFKNKQKSKISTSLLVLISTEIIPVDDDVIANTVTADTINDAKETMFGLDSRAKDMDPIHRWFFNDTTNGSAETTNEFVSHEQAYLIPNQQVVEGKKKRLSEYL